MRAKILLLVLPLAAITAPVSAQEVVYASGTGDSEYGRADAPEFNDADVEYDDYDDGARLDPIAGRLSDPMVHDTVAIMVESMAGAIMNMPIDGITQAIETARPGAVRRQYRRGATVADVAGRDARYLPEELGDESRAAIGMMGGVARAMANMMPAFENLSREMQDQIRAAKDEARRARDR
jgi:hypothetical protein